MADASSAALPGPAAPPRKQSYIFGPVPDVLLFILSPMLIFPLVFAWSRAASAELVALMVGSLGALGHHLPGMMRAYGDQALFRRFRTRFIVAPILLVAICLFASFTNPAPLTLVLFGWGVWHALMQTHGFARIYDTRGGAGEALTARLDHLLVLTWFVATVIVSPTRVPAIAELLMKSGVPPFSLGSLAVVRGLAVAATAAVTLVFVANLLRRWRAGVPPSGMKLGFIAASLATWAGANILVPNLLLAVVLFEIFHDIQYLSIVWAFNRRRATSDTNAGGFTRFLFRKRGGLIVLYLLLVFGYGSLGLLKGVLPADTGPLSNLLVAVILASTLLHFYFDGFIWKIREPQNREALGLAKSATAGGGQGSAPAASWVPHALKWAIFAVPLGALMVLAAVHPIASDARDGTLAVLDPRSAVRQYNVGIVRYTAGDLPGAIDAYRRAYSFEPDTAEVHEKARYNLMATLVESARAKVAAGLEAEAQAELSEANSVEPSLLQTLVERTIAFADDRRPVDAQAEGRLALLLAPDDPDALLALGLARFAAGAREEAAALAARAALRRPGDPRIERLVAATASPLSPAGGP